MSIVYVFSFLFITKTHNTPVLRSVSENMGEVRAVTDGEFESSVNDSEWVLVDFWAPWCGPCKAIAPVLEQVAGEREILIAKVDTDTNPANAAKLGVRGIPALFLYHNGNIVSKQSGAMAKPQLLKWIDDHMTADDF
jgi:thioredoxin 1